jgi:ABC-type branched-subunit amino acid transport system permease subunit
MLTHIANGLGLGFPIGTILAALFAGLIGVIIGLSAVRVRGVNLAIATLAAAAALDALVFNGNWFSGGFLGTVTAPPRIFGLDLGISKDGSQLVFGFFVLAVVVMVGIFIARLRGGPAGRMFLAVRSNERAAAAVGINVARTKLIAFGLGAVIAGIGGSLLAYQQGTIDYYSFTLWTSLTILALAYVGGVGRISGSVIAGFMLAANGVLPTFLNRLFDFSTYQGLIGGLALTLAAVGNPEGISKQMLGGFDKLSARVLKLLRSQRPSSDLTPPDSSATTNEVAANV